MTREPAEFDWGHWGCRIWYESEVMPWEVEGWRWSAMRFRYPSREDNDSTVVLGGKASSKKAGRLIACGAAARYDKLHPDHV